jgi:L-threonylcarbamoyladenylate synthase
MRRLTAPRDTAQAAAMLRAGQLVAFGTETVYGLGADATNPRAVAAIFAAKGRPRFNPLICHFAGASAAFAHVVESGMARTLAAAFWPGPLTLVLPRRPGTAIDLLAGAGLETLAVRVPAHAHARALLAAAGVPVAAPSANRSGAVSPTTAAHVAADLAGRIDAVLDCGPAIVGLESTVLDLCGPQPRLLRPGGAGVEAIEALIGPVARGADTNAARRSPGMLASHYAPSLPVRCDAETIHPGEALLAFGPPLPGAAPTWQLSQTADLTEAASRLFAGLRWLDTQGATGIAAMKIPLVGLGLAINDRLRRAAAPR